MASKKVTITLDENLVDELKEQGKKESRSLSNLISVILKAFLLKK